MTNDAFAEKLKAMRGKYLETVQQDYTVLAGLIARLDEDEDTEALRHDLRHLAHRMGGTGGSFGFPAISEAGKLLEEVLHYRKDAAAEELRMLAWRLLDACEAALESGSLEMAFPAAEAAVVDESHLPLILAVDDDASLLDMLKTVFRGHARVMCRTKTQEAVALAMEHHPDMIFLDENFPDGVSGLDVMRQLKSIRETQSIPVIIITGDASPDRVMDALLAGAADYVTKPFQPEELLHKIRIRLLRHSTTILIADDDEAIRELLAHKFGTTGCQVIKAANGEEAWETLLTKPCSLAVLDYMMPVYDGMTVLRMLKETPRLSHVPVVFLTARHYGSDVVEGLESGAADYITKPFNPDEVVARCLRLVKQIEKEKGQS